MKARSDKERLDRIEKTLETLIGTMVQRAASPITLIEATDMLNILYGSNK